MKKIIGLVALLAAVGCSKVSGEQESAKVKYTANVRPICTIAVMGANNVIYQFVFRPEIDARGKVKVGGNGGARVYTPNPSAPNTGIEYIPSGSVVPYKAPQGQWHAYSADINGYKVTFQVGEEGGFAAYLKGRGLDLSATRGACIDQGR